MFALFSYSCESAQLTRLTMPSRPSFCSWFGFLFWLASRDLNAGLLFLILRASQMPLFVRGL